ncbi:MAG TPA: DUF1611 domain-containing protein [Candidatus Dormibacteraeota bacterium]
MRLHPGDHLVGALGNRYATDYYEGYVLDSRCTHLLTAGGLIGTVVSAHDVRGHPTQLEIVGGLCDASSRPLSTEDFAALVPPRSASPPTTVAVVGSGMNAGKTTTAAALTLGWTRAGLRTGAGKVTGSGSGKDRWEYLDAGATAVADFLDFGMPSTFGYPLDRLASTMIGIRDRLAASGCDAVVLEIADGILMAETAHLLERLSGEVEAVILATGDALSARAGVDILRELGLPVRAISGLVSRSPLAAREAQSATGLPVLTAAELASGAALTLLPADARTG